MMTSILCCPTDSAYCRGRSRTGRHPNGPHDPFGNPKRSKSSVSFANRTCLTVSCPWMEDKKSPTLPKSHCESSPTGNTASAKTERTRGGASSSSVVSCLVPVNINSPTTARVLQRTTFSSRSLVSQFSIRRHSSFSFSSSSSSSCSFPNAPTPISAARACEASRQSRAFVSSVSRRHHGLLKTATSRVSPEEPPLRVESNVIKTNTGASASNEAYTSCASVNGRKSHRLHCISLSSA
mmetsp:Transcript_1150/g.3784  ORF Transcript_1150/g.3784 Transcript_1150/m.3784 type:complete len:238 (+) Transcript_1150:1595-2308(+)